MADGGLQAGGTGEVAVVVLQSRRQAARLLLLSAIFVGLGAVLMAVTGGTEQRVWGGVTIAFFGLGLVVFGWQLIRPGSLTIGSAGLTERVLGRTRRIAWSEAVNFRVWEFNRVQLVAFDDLRPADVQARTRAMNKALGAESALKAGWTVPAADLAALLNAARARWEAQGGQG